jgi:glycosyltransferase involved in cell wall biosynthesis
VRLSPLPSPFVRKAPARWSILLPFFNEARFVGTTLASLASQSDECHVILIDNGSTDGSAAIAVRACRRLGLSFQLVIEPRPGKVAALRAGLRWVRTPLVATCDADTFYPPDYLKTARRILGETGVMAGAWFRERFGQIPSRQRWLGRLRAAISPALLRGQCLSGGAGQCFRTDALRAAGGFDPERWNWVLEDHEVCHRVAAIGALRYDPGLWCAPARRLRRRSSTGWSLPERLLYHLTASWAGGWYFGRFLGPRLARRGLLSERLRETDEPDPR